MFSINTVVIPEIKPASSTPRRVPTLRLARFPCAICGEGKDWQINGTPDGYYCGRCLSDIFPFCGITNDRDFKEAINGFSTVLPTFGYLGELD